MKSKFLIRLCRDGVSKAAPKYEKSGAAANEIEVFDSAVPERSIQGGVKVRKVGRSGK